MLTIVTDAEAATLVSDETLRVRLEAHLRTLAGAIRGIENLAFLDADEEPLAAVSLVDRGARCKWTWHRAPSSTG